MKFNQTKMCCLVFKLPIFELSRMKSMTVSHNAKCLNSNNNWSGQQRKVEQELLANRKCALRCVVLHYIVLSCIVLRYITLHCVVLHCVVLHCVVLHCVKLHCVVLHCVKLYSVVLRCVTLCCVSCRWPT